MADPTPQFLSVFITAASPGATDEQKAAVGEYIHAVERFCEGGSLAYLPVLATGLRALVQAEVLNPRILRMFALGIKESRDVEYISLQGVFVGDLISLIRKSLASENVYNQSVWKEALKTLAEASGHFAQNPEVDAKAAEAWREIIPGIKETLDLNAIDGITIQLQRDKLSPLLARAIADQHVDVKAKLIPKFPRTPELEAFWQGPALKFLGLEKG